MTLLENIEEMLGDNPRWIESNKSSIRIEISPQYAHEAKNLDHNFDGVKIEVNPTLKYDRIRLITILEERDVI